MMPKKLIKLIEDSDLFLFTGGGCHIFARELMALLPDEKFTLRQIVQIRPEKTARGYHVFLQSENFGVDALGIHRLEDMLASYYARPYHHVDWTYHFDDATISECFEIDHERSQEQFDIRGPVNKWNLFLHPEFIEIVASRARHAISGCENRYKVSMLREGHLRAERASAESSVF